MKKGINQEDMMGSAPQFSNTPQIRAPFNSYSARNLALKNIPLENVQMNLSKDQQNLDFDMNNEAPSPKPQFHSKQITDSDANLGESQFDELMLMENDDTHKDLKLSDLQRQGSNQLRSNITFKKMTESENPNFSQGPNQLRSNITFKKMEESEHPNVGFIDKLYQKYGIDENTRQVRLWSDDDETIGNQIYGKSAEEILIPKNKPSNFKKTSPVFGQASEVEQEPETAFNNREIIIDSDAKFKNDAISSGQLNRLNKLASDERNNWEDVIYQPQRSPRDASSSNKNVINIYDKEDNMWESNTSKKEKVAPVLKKNQLDPKMDFLKVEPVANLDIKRKKIPQNDILFSFNQFGKELQYANEELLKPEAFPEKNLRYSTGSASRDKKAQRLSPPDNEIESKNKDFVDLIKIIKKENVRTPSKSGSRPHSPEESNPLMTRVSDHEHNKKVMSRKESAQANPHQDNIRFSDLVDSNHQNPQESNHIQEEQQQPNTESPFLTLLNMRFEDQMFYFAQHLIRENEKMIEHENSIKSLQQSYHTKLEQATLFKNNLLVLYKNQPEYNKEFLSSLYAHYDSLKKEISGIKKIYDMNSKLSSVKAENISQAQELLFSMEGQEDSDDTRRLMEHMVSILDYLDTLQPVFDLEFDIDKKIMFSCMTDHGISSKIEPLPNNQVNLKLKYMIDKVEFNSEEKNRRKTETTEELMDFRASFQKQNRIEKVLDEINSKYKLDDLRKTNVFKKRDHHDVSRQYDRSARVIVTSKERNRPSERKIHHEKKKSDRIIKMNFVEDVAKIDRLLRGFKTKFG